VKIKKRLELWEKNMGLTGSCWEHHKNSSENTTLQFMSPWFKHSPSSNPFPNTKGVGEEIITLHILLSWDAWTFSFIFPWVPNFAKTNGFRQDCGVLLVPTPELLLQPFFLLQPYTAMTPNSSNARWEHGRQCCLFWVNFCIISIW